MAINPDIFTEFFSNVFLKFLPNETTGALLGIPAISIAESLDKFIQYGYGTAERVIEQGGWLSVGKYILAAIIYAGTVMAGSVSFVIAAMALIVLGTLLVVGPIFVSFMLFEVTNRWFWSWLSNLFSFALMQILLVALLIVAGSVIEILYETMIAKVNLDLLTPEERFMQEHYGINRVSNAAAFGILTVYVITIFLFRKLPELTSNIGGGISVGLQGFTNSAKNSLTKPFTAPYKAVKGYVGGINKAGNKVYDFLTARNTQTNSNSALTQLKSSGSSGSASVASASPTSSASNNKATTSPEQIQSYTAPISSALSVPSATTTSMSISIGGQPVVYGSEAVKVNSSKPGDSTRVRRLTPVANSAGSAAISNPTGNPGTYEMPPSTGSSGNLGSSKTSESSGSPQPPNSTGEKPGSSQSSSSSGSSVTPSLPRSSTKEQENEDEVL